MKLTPVDYDPFAGPATPRLVPVDYDPFSTKERSKFARGESARKNPVPEKPEEPTTLQKASRATAALLGLSPDEAVTGAGAVVEGTGSAVEGLSKVGQSARESRKRFVERQEALRKHIESEMAKGVPYEQARASAFQAVPEDVSAVEFTPSIGEAIQETGREIQQSATPDYRRQVEGSGFEGDITSPSTWGVKDDTTFRGLAGQALRIGGQMAPVAASAFIPGVGPAVAVGAAGGQSAEGAYEEQSQRILNMPIEELRQVPGYDELTKTLPPYKARQELARRAGQAAMGPAATVGAVSGVIPGGRLTSAARTATTRALGNNVAGRAAGEALQAPLEGLTEVGETAAAIGAANRTTGESRSTTEGSFENLVLGAAGAGPGIAIGALTPSEADYRAQAETLKAERAVAETPEQVGTLDAEIALAEARADTEATVAPWRQRKAEREANARSDSSVDQLRELAGTPQADVAQIPETVPQATAAPLDQAPDAGVGDVEAEELDRLLTQYFPEERSQEPTINPEVVEQNVSQTDVDGQDAPILASRNVPPDDGGIESEELDPNDPLIQRMLAEQERLMAARDTERREGPSDALTEGFRALAKNPELFRTGMLKDGNNLRELAPKAGLKYGAPSFDKDVQLPYHAIIVDQGAAGQREAKVFTTPNAVWIDISDLKAGGGGGDAVYNIAQSLAVNTGKEFIQDPAGLSDTAMYRRPMNQTSGILKADSAENFPVGEFLASQRVGGPATRPIKEDGKRRINPSLREHLLTNYHNATLAVPEVKGIRYDADSEQFVDRAGQAVTDADFQRLADYRLANPIGPAMVRKRTEDGGAKYKAPVGRNTLKVAALVETLVGTADPGARAKLVDKLRSIAARSPGAGSLGQLEGILPSRRVEDVSKGGKGEPAGASRAETNQRAGKPDAQSADSVRPDSGRTTDPAGTRMAGDIPRGSGNGSIGARVRSDRITTDAVRDSIVKAFGYRAKRLLDSGKTKVVQNERDVPAEIRSRSEPLASADGTIQGFYDQKTGDSYLIADNFKRLEDVAPVFLHEEGVHAGMKAILGDRFDAIAKRLGEIAENGNATDKAIAAKAKRRAERAGTPDKYMNEEWIAYTVQLAEQAKQSESPPTHVLRRWLTSVYEAISAWAAQRGLKNLSINDLRVIAIGALGHRARAEGSGKMYAVSPEQAKRIEMETDLPTSDEFINAVANTPGAKITEDGLLINLVRFQKEEQDGATSVRTGVFYLPTGASQEKFYKTGKSGYGGKSKHQADTLLRKPLFVSGATGGKAPESAYNTLKGKGAYKAMREDVLSAISGWGIRESQKAENVYAVLEKYESDPDLAWEIVENSKQGNTLAYAVQENIVAHAVRAAGYDSVVGHSRGKISEIFDVREVSYPAEGAEADIHSDFNLKPSRAPKDTITVDGKERPRLNSNGKPIAETDEALINFWRWFGDSKVTDDQGRPKVVYHGTASDVESFDPKLSGSKSNTGAPAGSFFFTDAPDVASSYTVAWRGEWSVKLHDNGNVIPVYLAIKYPFTINAKGESWRNLQYKGEDADINEIVAVVQGAGKADGLIAKKISDKGVGEVTNKTATTYVAFKPSQIKSATGNRGTFSPSDDSILASKVTPETPIEDMTDALAKDEQQRAKEVDLYRESAAKRINEAGKRAEEKRQEVTSSLGVTGPSLTWSLDEGRFEEGAKGLFARLRGQLQDKFLSVLGAQQDIEAAGKVIEESQNVYRRENLMHGRVAEQIKHLTDRRVKPIKRMMKEEGVSLEVIEDYLEARFAEERNKHIAKINPTMPDGGSGMLTQEAKDFLAGNTEGHRSKGKLTPELRKKAEKIAERLDTIRDETLTRQKESGLITPEQYAEYSKNKLYAPLRGKDGDEIGGSVGTGGGVDVRGKMHQRALGRGAGNRATDIVANIIGDAERTIVQAEKTRVGQTLLRLVLSNPNKDVWEVEPVQVERKFSETQGTVYDAVKAVDNDPGSVRVMVKGKPYRILLKDERMAKAIKNLGAEQMNAVLRFMGALNRYFSAILTRYNPSFVPINMIRDLGLGIVGITSEHGFRAGKDAVSSYLPAMRALWREARGKSPAGQSGVYAKEFSDAGGRTGFHSYQNVEEITNQIRTELKSVMQIIRDKDEPALNKLARVYAKGATGLKDNAIIQVIEDANDTIENAMRLSAFIARRKKGDSVETAAEYAKNITVNFNRRGHQTSLVNSLFLFFNAATQGSVRTFQLLKNPKVQATMAGLASLQFVLASLAMMDEDDDGLTAWEKIPDYEKERNLIFPIVGEEDGKMKIRTVKIPMPYGFNFFPYMGGRLAQAMKSKEEGDTWKLANDLGAASIDAVSPVKFTGGTRGYLPYLANIFVSLGYNKNDFGDRITDERPYSAYEVPRASLGRATTPDVYHKAAKALNRLGGGDDVTKPKIMENVLDWSPEDLRYLTEAFTGGIGRTLNQSVGFGQKAYAGLDLSTSDVPVLKSLIGDVSMERATQSTYYARKEEIARESDRVRMIYREQGKEAALEHMKKTPALSGMSLHRFKTGKVENKNGDIQLDAKKGSLLDTYKQAEKELDDISSELKAARTNRTLSLRDKLQRIEELEKKREAAQRKLNVKWRESNG